MTRTATQDRIGTTGRMSYQSDIYRAEYRVVEATDTPDVFIVEFTGYADDDLDKIVADSDHADAWRREMADEAIDRIGTTMRLRFASPADWHRMF